jgi:hypothetical protein
MKNMFNLLGWFGLLVLASTCFSALPDNAVTEGERNAAEILDIVVMKIDSQAEENSEWIAVRVSAQVTDVRKSESGVKEGDSLVIMYSSYGGEFVPPGADNNHIPEVGDELVAYLHQGEKKSEFRPVQGINGALRKKPKAP